MTEENEIKEEKNLKERIQKKLDEKVEKILAKDEIDENDVSFLKSELFRMVEEDSKVERQKKKDEIFNSLKSLY